MTAAKKCGQCNKVITGYNLKHVEYLMRVHKEYKHPEAKR